MHLDYPYHFELAQKLSALRTKGILIVGSGNIVHNLGLVDFHNFDKDNYGYDWAIEARETINNYLLDGNFQPLIDFEKQNKAFQLAIPTPEHYLPLIYTLKKATETDRKHYFNTIKRYNNDTKRVKELIAFVKSSGGLDYAISVMKDYQQRAKNILNEFPDSEAKHSLNLMLDYVIERKF